MVKKITAAQLLDVDASAVTLLDVRTAMEYGLGTVPGSLNAPFGYDDEEFDEVAWEVINGMPKDVPVYTFCHMGPRSEIAAEVLEEQGFDVVDVEDGYRAYQVALIEREN